MRKSKTSSKCLIETLMGEEKNINLILIVILIIIVVKDTLAANDTVVTDSSPDRS